MPCNVIDVDDREAQIISMSENVARQSLTPIEEARAYATYFRLDIKAGKKFLKLSEILPRGTIDKDLKNYADKIGTSDITVRKRIPLLFLIEDVQTMI